MNSGERIEILEQELRALAADLTESRERMLRLFAELQKLKKEPSLSLETDESASFKKDSLASSTGEVVSTSGRDALSSSTGEGVFSSGTNPLASPRPRAASRVSTGTPPVRHDLQDLTGLKLIHLVGIVVLLTGISIGVKYAIDRELISEAARIGLAYAAGAVLLILSVRLKKGYNFFSAILFSGAMACWYFTTYGALAYYHFINPAVAFLIMIALTVVTVLQSIAYDRREIAIIGLVGAYGIPFLVSNNTGRIDLFFSYILLINLGVVYLGYRKTWRLVSQLAMYATWIMFIGWEMFAAPVTRMPLAIGFTAAFWVLFVAEAMLVGVRLKKKVMDAEVLQVFVNNSALGISLFLIFNRPGQEDYVSAGLCCLFALLAWLAGIFFPAAGRLQRSLVIQSLVMGVVFIAVSFNGFQVTLGWLLVAAGLFITGMIRERPWLREASLVVMGCVLVKLVTFDAMAFTAIQRIIAFLLTGVLILAGSFYYQKVKRKVGG